MDETICNKSEVTKIGRPTKWSIQQALHLKKIRGRITYYKKTLKDLKSKNDSKFKYDILRYENMLSIENTNLNCFYNNTNYDSNDIYIGNNINIDGKIFESSNTIKSDNKNVRNIITNKINEYTINFSVYTNDNVYEETDIINNINDNCYTSSSNISNSIIDNIIMYRSITYINDNLPVFKSDMTGN